MNVIFLAAGKSSRIYKILRKPKCLLDFKGISLIEKLIKNFSFSKKIKLNIVVGFKSSMIKNKLKRYKNINFIFNKDYNKKEMLYSMILALKKINDNAIISYSDIWYDKSICKILIKKKNNIYLPILSNWKKIWKVRKKNMYQDAENLQVDKKLNLKKIGQKIKLLKKVEYQYMGLIFIPKSKIKKIINVYESIENKEKMHLTKFLDKILNFGMKIKCIKYKKDWYEFDDIDDYKNYIKN